MSLIIPQTVRAFSSSYKAVFGFVRHYGSSTEMPLVGTKGWQLMLENLTSRQAQHPLNRADIQTSRRLRLIESDMSEIKELMRKVVDSNREMQQSFTRMEHRNIAREQ